MKNLNVDYKMTCGMIAGTYDNLVVGPQLALARVGWPMSRLEVDFRGLQYNVKDLLELL